MGADNKAIQQPKLPDPLVIRLPNRDGSPCDITITAMPEADVLVVFMVTPGNRLRWFVVDDLWEARKPSEAKGKTYRMADIPCFTMTVETEFGQVTQDHRALYPPDQVAAGWARKLKRSPEGRIARALKVEARNGFLDALRNMGIPTLRRCWDQARFDLAVKTWDLCQDFREGAYRGDGRPDESLVAAFLHRKRWEVHRDRQIVCELLTGLPFEKGHHLFLRRDPDTGLSPERSFLRAVKAACRQAGTQRGSARTVYNSRLGEDVESAEGRRGISRLPTTYQRWSHMFYTQADELAEAGAQGPLAPWSFSQIGRKREAQRSRDEPAKPPIPDPSTGSRVP